MSLDQQKPVSSLLEAWLCIEEHRRPENLEYTLNCSEKLVKRMQTLTNHVY